MDTKLYNRTLCHSPLKMYAFFCLSMFIFYLTYTYFSLLLQGLENIPRESYYLATKVGRYLPEPTEMFDFRAERVIRSVDESLERLGLNYIDIIQVH